MVRIQEPLEKTFVSSTRHGRACPTGGRHGLCLKECTALILFGSSWLRIIWTRREIKAVRHQNIVFHELLKQIPWSVVDRLVDEHGADDGDRRRLKTKPHLIAMLYAQFCGLRGLRQIETNLQSHASKTARTASRSNEAWSSAIGAVLIHKPIDHAPRNLLQ